jgi:hypothetical protein
VKTVIIFLSYVTCKKHGNSRNQSSWVRETKVKVLWKKSFNLNVQVTPAEQVEGLISDAGFWTNVITSKVLAWSWR